MIDCMKPKSIKPKKIEILRLGHRLPRDERISTHVALVARAFGADGLVYSGQHDAGFESSVLRLAGEWGARTPAGGTFSISYEKNPMQFIRAKKRDGYSVAHLTMYGIPLMEKIEQVRSQQTLLVIVGSEHVPGEVYELADFNISVTNQPHSEVAALAIALDRILDGKAIAGCGKPGCRGGFDFGGKIRIEPSEKGKRFFGAGRTGQS